MMSFSLKNQKKNEAICLSSCFIRFYQFTGREKGINVQIRQSTPTNILRGCCGRLDSAWHQRHQRANHHMDYNVCQDAFDRQADDKRGEYSIKKDKFWIALAKFRFPDNSHPIFSLELIAKPKENQDFHWKSLQNFGKSRCSLEIIANPSENNFSMEVLAKPQENK